MVERKYRWRILNVYPEIAVEASRHSPEPKSRYIKSQGQDRSGHAVHEDLMVVIHQHLWAISGRARVNSATLFIASPFRIFSENLSPSRLEMLLAMFRLTERFNVAPDVIHLVGLH
jgi:hypothetical protein